jgi:O-antigen/teichoic acid export membrane protein
LNFIKNIFKSQLFRLSSLNSVSVLIRVIGGLLSSKMIALFIGPSGMAVTGNLRNFLGLIDSVSILGLHNGIIKYTAENEKNKERLHTILSTIFIAIVAWTLILIVVLFVFSGVFNKWIFGDNHHIWVFRLLAILLPLYTSNLVFIAVLNGLRLYKQIILINIIGNVVGVLLSALLIYQYHLSGALFALAAYPATLFLFSYYYMRRQFHLPSFFKIANFDKNILKGLLSYSLMSLVTVVLSSLIFIAIRNLLAENYSAKEAGYWEAINRISSFYLMFASTLLTVYFLPKLSVAKSDIETKSIFWSYYKAVLPVFTVGLIVVFFLKSFIISVLLSAEFLPMDKLFKWQLLGDFFKIASIILGYEFFAKKMTTAFVVTEVFSFVVLYVLSHILINRYGTTGAVMAYAYTYIIYFITLSIYFKKKLFTTPSI